GPSGRRTAARLARISSARERAERSPSAADENGETETMPCLHDRILLRSAQSRWSRSTYRARDSTTGGQVRSTREKSMFSRMLSTETPCRRLLRIEEARRRSREDRGGGTRYGDVRGHTRGVEQMGPVRRRRSCSRVFRARGLGGSRRDGRR